jgi:hypothetical protein
MKLKNKLTPYKLRKIKKLLKTCPGGRLVSGACGLVTCDGYAVELINGGGVLHPLAFLDLMSGSPPEPIDILKGRLCKF